MKIIVLGKNGMLGKYIFSYFKINFIVHGVTRSELDVSDTDNLKNNFRKIYNLGLNDLVINCVGTIKPRCDELGPINAIKVNSMVPRILAEDSNERGYKLLHPTTDCIYSGKTGAYTENNEMDVSDIYGLTKYLGEPPTATNLRVSIIGEETVNKRSLVEWCKTLDNKDAKGFTDHLWNGVTCLTYAKIIETMIEKNIWWKGTRHALSPRSLNKYELVKLITNTYKIKVNLKEAESGTRCDRTLQTIHKENSLFNIPDLTDQLRHMQEFSKELYS
jgi:dTDP-4-dehydrorhamnose reductase